MDWRSIGNQQHIDNIGFAREIAISITQLEKTFKFKHSQGNEIGDEGAKKIGEALATNNTLTTLNLEVKLLFLQM